VAGTGPERRDTSFRPRYVFFYLFILLLMFLCFYRLIYYFNTLRYDGGEGMAGAGPKRRDTSFGPRYVFFNLNIHSFTNVSLYTAAAALPPPTSPPSRRVHYHYHLPDASEHVHTTSTRQNTTTTTSTRQNASTTTTKTHNRPRDVCVLGPGVFFSFFFMV
jgi:hypothetical protein